METYNSIISKPIPLCEPNLNGNEKSYIVDSIDSNWLSAGSYLNLFEKKLSEFTGASYAIGTSSGTTALQISLILAGVELNDLVLIPNLTFVATANSIKYIGADPILIDVDPHTWVIDLELLKHFFINQTYLHGEYYYHKESNRRIKAVIPVHLLGNMCDMSELIQMSAMYRFTIIEDAACSLGSFQNSKHSGTFGLAGTISFNSNKIITTGGGGAILTNDEFIAKKARHLISQAKSSNIEYFHDSLGFNYRLVNPLAAIGAAQMELLPGFLERKKDIKDYYIKHLKLTENQFQIISPNTISNFWHFVLLTKNSRELISFLAKEKIESRPLWIPINELPVFKDDIYITQKNYSKNLSSNGIMLPCSTSITDEQLSKVCNCIEKFFNQ